MEPTTVVVFVLNGVVTDIMSNDPNIQAIVVDEDAIKLGEDRPELPQNLQVIW